MEASLKAACPFCGQHLEFALSCLGSEIDCPGCGQRIQLEQVGNLDFLPPIHHKRARGPISWVIFGICGVILIAAMFGIGVWSNGEGRDLSRLFSLEALAIIFTFSVVFMVYFLPTFVGRNKRNGSAIFVLNLLAGWTVLGWIVALVWACCQDDPKYGDTATNGNGGKVLK